MAYQLEAKPTTKRLRQYIATIAATIGALASGTIMGWTAPTQPLLVKSPNSPDDWTSEYPFEMDTEMWSWIGSSTTLGSALMVALTGPLLNLIGRKTTMLLMIVPFTIGWSLVIWASSFGMLLTGRVFLGIAGGSFCIVSPIYTAEIADKEIRGSLGSYFQFMLTVGVLFVYSVASGVSVFVLSIICGIIPFVYTFVFFFMPETPLYYVSKNRPDDAIKSLIWLRGDQYDYKSELRELQEDYEQRKLMRVSFIAPFRTRATVRALIICGGLMMFQQMSGFNVVIFYTTDILASANTGLDEFLATILVGVMQVASTFVAILIVDRVGRKLMLIASTATMSICTILIGVYFYLMEVNQGSVENLGWLPIVAMCLFITMFSIGFGPIPWLLVGELFASDIKGPAASFVGFFSWILAFVVTKTFTNMQQSLGTGQTFWLFGGFLIAGTVFVIVLVKETKGKSLIEIQQLLAGETEDSRQKNST